MTRSGCVAPTAASRVQPRRSIVAATLVSDAASVPLACTATPAPNLAFRALVSHRALPRGNNGLTVVELWQRAAWHAFNQRLALMAAPLPLSACAWRVVAPWGEWMRTLVGAAGLLVYAAHFVILPPHWQAPAPVVSPVLGVGLPSLLLETVAFAPRIGPRRPALR